MIQLVYVSRAILPCDDDELANILVKSRTNNSRRGITGMLVYHDGIFLQILEGKETLVEPLYDRIGLDPRHCDCNVLLRSYIDRRSFGEWSMGFANVRDLSPETLPGYNDFFGKAFELEAFAQNPSTAVKILHAFRAANNAVLRKPHYRLSQISFAY